MQVKVFEAADMASGLRKIRQELGPDALILSTRTVKNGKLGLLGKGTLEITAAIDKPWPEEKQPAAPGGLRSQARRAYEQSSGSDTAPSPAGESPSTAPPAASPEPEEVGKTSDSPALRQEFDELKDMVKSLAGEISRIGTREPAAAPAAHSLLNTLEHRLRSTNSSTPIEDLLLAQGVDDEAARVIARFAGERLQPGELQDAGKIQHFLQETLADVLTVNPPDFTTFEGQKRIALIGPTGVGKTTTLAKIAAGFLASRSSSIAFITIDTYRIAAVEQLKVYGEIMHLPVEVVITPSQLRDSLEKHADKELILIDTAGRSPLDPLGIEEIRTFFADDLAIDNYLVLSATTRDNELNQIFHQFRNVSIHSTIFTKTDECSTLGVLLNMQVKNGIPVSYITNGQRVPEDIVTADQQELARLILPSAHGNAHE